MTDEEREARYRKTGLSIWREDAIEVDHPYTGGPYGGFILLPLGLRINRDVEAAAVGSVLEFSDAVRARVLVVKRVRCNDPITGGMAWVRYGIYMKDLREKWRRDMIYMGAGVNAIDSDECLMVFYKRKEG